MLALMGRGGQVNTCFLCPSPAVADGLCVSCGAKKWAADLWERDMHEARKRVNGAREGAVRGDERELAVCQIDGPHHARAFLSRLDAARKARGDAPCKHGCRSHEEQ